MGNVVEIWKVNWRQNLRYHALAALFFCFMMPILFDVKGLDQFETAKVLEFYLILLGVICMIPVFLPDLDPSIRNLLDTKRTFPCTVCALRFFQSFLLMIVLTGGMLLYLRCQGCSFSFFSYFAGAVAGMLFLGGQGMLVLSLSHMMPLAYMIPVLYYVANMGSGKKFLGNWYLNSMYMGSFTEKWYLFFTGVGLILLSFLARMYVGKGKVFSHGRKIWQSLKKVRV